jgi:hypothetical protein
MILHCKQAKSFVNVIQHGDAEMATVTELKMQLSTAVFCQWSSDTFFYWNKIIFSVYLISTTLIGGLQFIASIQVI